MSKPIAIDLFCGLGGFTEGLLAEGYNPIGFDIEAHDYGDGKRYHAQLVIQDVLTIHGRQFKDAALIVASPPCQFFSYCAMPWSRAKKLAAEVRASKERTDKELALFRACFRIQREAIEAAGHFIPMVVENVRGAQPWVGRARWNYGSFYLWGDVPALMPITMPRDARKQTKFVPNRGWTASTAIALDLENYNGTKLPGNSGPRRWDERQVQRLCDATKVPSENGRRTDVGSGARFTSRDCGVERDGIKQGGDWLNQSQPSISRLTGSKSNARKADSATIAKIPLPLARWIAKVYYPKAVAV